MIVRKVGWLAVREKLVATFDGDEALIKQDVDNGVASCWMIGGVCMISRRENYELVVMCLAGEGLAEVAPVLKAAAKKAGCKSIRLHTKRRGLLKLLQPFGVALQEYILKVSL